MSAVRVKGRVRRRGGTRPSVASVWALLLVAVAAAAWSASTRPVAAPGINPISNGGSTSIPVPQVTARLQGVSLGTDTTDPDLLYDMSAQGTWAAYRDTEIGPGPLHLAGPGGVSDLLLGPTDELAPRLAVFSPESKTLAVVDGDGGLWAVDLPSEHATLLAKDAGYHLAFGQWAKFSSESILYVQLVGSIEVPVPAEIATFNLDTREVHVLSEDQWAFGVQPIGDSTYIYTHMNDDGSFELRHVAAGSSDIANLGFMHGGIDTDRFGNVAYSDGTTTFLLRAGSKEPLPIALGISPHLGPDGTSLTVYQPTLGRTALLGLDGSVAATNTSAFARAVTCTGEVCP